MAFFNEDDVVNDVQRNRPPPRSLWEAKDFLDKDLLAQVHIEFGRAGSNYHAFILAVDSARSVVYDERCQMLTRALGLPHTQWHILDRACQQLGIRFRSFAGSEPHCHLGPADLAYTARYCELRAPMMDEQPADRLQSGPSPAETTTQRTAAVEAAPQVAPRPAPKPVLSRTAAGRVGKTVSTNSTAQLPRRPAPAPPAATITATAATAPRWTPSPSWLAEPSARLHREEPVAAAPALEARASAAPRPGPVDSQPVTHHGSTATMDSSNIGNTRRRRHSDVRTGFDVVSESGDFSLITTVGDCVDDFMELMNKVQGRLDSRHILLIRATNMGLTRPSSVNSLWRPPPPPRLSDAEMLALMQKSHGSPPGPVARDPLPAPLVESLCPGETQAQPDPDPDQHRGRDPRYRRRRRQSRPRPV